GAPSPNPPSPSTTAAASSSSAPPFARAAGTATATNEPERKMLYEGNPSWKAYLGYYLIAGFGGLVLIAILNMIAGSGAPAMTKVLDVLVPIALATVFTFGVTLFRKSLKFRVTSTVIEYE